MRYTQENFQEWIFFISDKMEYFTGTFAKEHGLVLDYSKKSLDDLERWILDNFNGYFVRPNSSKDIIDKIQNAHNVIHY